MPGTGLETNEQREVEGSATTEGFLGARLISSLLIDRVTQLALQGESKPSEEATGERAVEGLTIPAISFDSEPLTAVKPSVARTRRRPKPPKPDTSPPAQEDIDRDKWISDIVSQAITSRSAASDYWRTVKEIWNISPTVWKALTVVTTLSAIFFAASTFAFSQCIAVIGGNFIHGGTSSALDSLALPTSFFVVSILFYGLYHQLNYKSTLLTRKHADEVDLKLDRKIRQDNVSLPEEIRQREDVAELLNLVHNHQDSSKRLVSGIVELSQECIELAITAATIIATGGGLSVIPLVLSGLVRYRSTQRISLRTIESEEQASEYDVLVADGDDALFNHASISNLQITGTSSIVVNQTMEWKAMAAKIRREAAAENARDEKNTDLLLSLPVSLSCLYLISQFGVGAVSGTACIWLLMSIWNLHSSLDSIGSLLSDQKTDVKLAGYRHAFADVAPLLSNPREKVRLEAAPAIRFENVRLRRPGSLRDTLKTTSFEIPAGSSVAIVGNNGQGKSSLIGLILGRIFPSSGQVMIGGYDTQKYAILTGSLSQDFSLISGFTLRRNIEMDRVPLGGMTAEEALALLDVTDELLENKPDGLDTIVPGNNQSGTNLSGGQKQAVALARAIAPRPWLLVLDEPTAALGPVIQKKVHDAIFSLDPKPTLIIVTHKLEQVLHCDQVIVIERGSVVEQGTPGELLGRRKGKLRALFRAQQGVARRKTTSS